MFMKMEVMLVGWIFTSLFSSPAMASDYTKLACIDIKPAYFEFKGSNPVGRFVIKLTDQVKIQQARDLVHKNRRERLSVMGIIVKEQRDYNSDWSYHLAPESISFFRYAIEVCDANMQYVEDNLDAVGGSFLPGNRWCPWHSQLVREIKNN